MMPWQENLLQCTFLALFLLTTFWVATKVLWKNPDDALITEFVANLTLRLLLDQRQLLPLHTPFFANSSHFFHFSTLQHFTFFASTFRIFRQTFPFYFPPLSSPFFAASAFFMCRVWPGCSSICVVNYEKAKSHSSTSLPPSPTPHLPPHPPTHTHTQSSCTPLPFHLLTF